MIATNIRMALASIKASRTRSFLTMTGVVIGVASVVVTVGIAEGFKHQIVSQINQYGEDVVTIRSGKTFDYNKDGSIKSVNINAQQGASTLNEKDVEALKSIPNTTAIVPNMQISGVVSTDENPNYSAVNIVGTTANIQQTLGSKVEFGDFFGDNDNTRNVVVIGSDVAADIFHAREPIGQTVTIRGKNFIVRGVLKPFQNSPVSVTDNINKMIYMPIGTAKQLSENTGQINSIYIKAKDTKSTDTVAAKAKNILLKNHQNQEDFTVIKKEDFLSATDNTYKQLRTFVVAIASTALIVGGIGIMNIMLVGVSERTKEIGVRKAVGATNQQILSQFLVEATVISVVGGFIGVVVALIATYFIRIGTSLLPVISLTTIFLACLVSLLVGIVFGMAPAIQAARKDPIQSLRHE